MEINISGGSGSDGQEGGNGGEGGKGANHYPESWPREICSEDELRKKFDYVKSTNCFATLDSCWDLRRDGNPGGLGGKGGDGGAGGKGAPPGELDFTNFASPHITPNFINKTGKDGEPGNGGVGGKGGLQGGGSDGRIRQKNFFLCHYDIRHNKLPSTKRAGSGASGMKGRNSDGQKFPTTTSFRFNRSKTIAEFMLLGTANQFPKFPNTLLPFLVKHPKMLPL